MPPISMIVLEVSRSTDLETFRTSTEYNAHVNAAASRLILPQNNEGESSALRGSMTASTPKVEMTKAMMRRVVGSEMGVKAAGGVKDYEQLKAMVAAGATRIGASAGVRIVQEARGEKVAAGSGY